MSQTYKPSRVKRSRKQGFLSRSKTSGGKRALKSRRRKGRKKLSV